MAAGPSSATSTADDNGLHLASFGIAAHTLPIKEGHVWPLQLHPSLIAVVNTARRPT